MTDEYVARAEHEEFCRRIDRENERQNRRLDIMEDDIRQLNQLTASIKELALSVQNMCREQERQGKRLSALEGKDGKKWQEAMKIIGAAVLGAIIPLLVQMFLK